MNLMYKCRPVNSWRLFEYPEENEIWRELEKHAPSMPSVSDMLKSVARDPVGQAVVFDLMVRLFLEHVLGATPRCGGSKFADGIAANGRGGLFGTVLAYFGPVETQGRGGLHAHIQVWILNPMRGAFLEKLRNGDPIHHLD